MNADGQHPRVIETPTPPQDEVFAGRVLLEDGSAATLRVVCPSDEPALRLFLDQLSADSRYMRFLSAFTPPNAPHAWSAQDDPRQKLTLVIVRARAGRDEILAVGAYARVDARTAEMSFAVADAVHGKGLGTILLERLALIAARHGFARLIGVRHTSNLEMRSVLRDSGFVFSERFDEGAMHDEILLEPVARTVERMDQRDHDATVASLAPLFAPRSVAVVGASRDAAGLGHRVFEKLRAGGFTGKVYPVNPGAREVAGCPAYATVAACPGPVDLAVICTPRDAAVDAIDEAGRAGVRAAVVITAGFAETGPDGAALQAALVAAARGHGMRIVGPNCMGLVNTDPAVRLDATFTPVEAVPGGVLMGSQSGALGLAVLARARELGLGMSTFVSLGNKADVSGNDLLLYGQTDPRTRVILLYLESIGNSRRFARIARRVARTKPIVCLKAGRSDAGRRAASSHTAALAGSDAVADALFAQAGVLRAETLEEMFELTGLLAAQPLPGGQRVALVTNAGGPAILCADACVAGGLSLAEFAEATRASLKAALPRAASLANPVDLIASATPDDFARTTELLLDDPGVDAVIALHVPLSDADETGVRAALADTLIRARRRGETKPLIACALGSARAAQPIPAGAEHIPVYAFPEAAGRALARAAGYAAWRAREPGVSLDFADIDRSRVRAVCSAVLARGDDVWLSPGEVQDVLDAMGIATCAARSTHSVEEAIEAAHFTGYPVALKLTAPDLQHKSDVGGVELGVVDEAALRTAYARILGAAARAGLTDRLTGVLVQRMAAPGVETMAGVTRDPSAGPVIAFGLGGVDVEVVRDVVLRLPPLTDRDATDMVDGLRGRRALAGYRGRPPADVPALAELLMRLSRLTDLVPEIEELDLNPVLAHPEGHGATVADARIRLRRRPAD